jgi:cell division protease FtsH
MSNMPEKPNRGPTPPPLPTRFGGPLMGWIVVIVLLVTMVSVWGNISSGGRTELSFDDFWTNLKNGHVVGQLMVHERVIEGTLDAATPGMKKDQSLKFFVNYSIQTDQNFRKDIEAANDAGGKKAKIFYPQTSWWEGTLPSLALTLVVFGALWFILFRRMGSAGGGGGFLGGFGRSRHRMATKEQSRVTFNDVAGIDEAKAEVAEIIEFLKNPRKFQRLGGRVPRGVLLVGDPGCGKTLLAKAIAGEAEVPFFSISGSDFVEMFVGVGASRVRDLFKQAKEASPCIIFLDEIDAVGRRRGQGFNGGGHDEREQTLNAILVEMDGFDSSDQIIVIAATNRSDVLDPALTRPGRFDRQITVPLPDLKGRYQILQIYINRVKCGPDVEINRLARGTPMFSGADLAAMVNEAAIAATMAEKQFIEMTDLEEARDKVRWGRARKSRVIDEQEREITAYHEAGHALVQVITPGADPVHKVSIIPRGGMGGATFSLPEKDRYLYTRGYCKGLLKVCLGGRLAELLFCNDVSSGASSDIVQATDIARKMVLDWGMSDKLGLVSYGPEEKRMMMPELGGKDYSDHTAETIDSEIKALIDEAYCDARGVIEANREKLEQVARALLKYETLTGDEVRAIIDGRAINKPTVGDLIDREQSKSPQAGLGAAVNPPPIVKGGAIPEPG